MKTDTILKKINTFKENKEKMCDILIKYLHILPQIRGRYDFKIGVFTFVSDCKEIYNSTYLNPRLSIDDSLIKEKIMKLNMDEFNYLYEKTYYDIKDVISIFENNLRNSYDCVFAQVDTIHGVGICTDEDGEPDDNGTN